MGFYMFCDKLNLSTFAQKMIDERGKKKMLESYCFAPDQITFQILGQNPGQFYKI